MQKEPFSIAIPEETLTDLRERLAKVRWPVDFANDQWQYGTNLEYLKELVDYWLHEYDWRVQERAMNAFSHYKTMIEGMPIHFIHEPGKGPNPTPLILNHGWPWTFWDLQKVIRPLTDPAAFGGDPKDAFDVVVPSLPGYGFSTPLTTTGINFWRTADLWVKLMQDVLGYKKFAAQGGDWGALITAQLGHKYADRVIGCHVHLMAPLNIFVGSMPEASEYGPDEKGWYERNMNFFLAESGYSALQSTKPQTIAFALNDSPVGLCAWILEKRRTWSDCGGDVEKRFSKDDLCTTMTIYWVTQSYGTSARYYYEATHNPWQASHNRTPVVEAPTGVALFSKEVILMPRKWADQYYNLKRWTVMPSGGHFASMEEPESLVEDIRAFFRPLRS
ncbi:MAG: alpha/beta fold hydrolase [Deltaproteobacteria bacterium]|nr:alpha/beta fold hydrolase [Deltaproteobacteria bacterium]